MIISLIYVKLALNCSNVIVEAYQKLNLAEPEDYNLANYSQYSQLLVKGNDMYYNIILPVKYSIYVCL